MRQEGFLSPRNFDSLAIDPMSNFGIFKCFKLSSWNNLSNFLNFIDKILAKYEKGVSTVAPPYQLKFSKDIKNCGYDELEEKPVQLDLLELTPELEKCLKQYL